jgi:hypothetical protein
MVITMQGIEVKVRIIFDLDGRSSDLRRQLEGQGRHDGTHSQQQQPISS